MSRSLTSVRRRALRVPAVLAAGLTAGALLAGCGGDGSEEPAAGSSSAPSSSESSAPASTSEAEGGGDLSAGLLPAEAFGPQAQVQELTQEQLEQGAVSAAGALDGAQITPPECAAALQTTQPQFDQYDDLAAQVAVVGTTATVQLLASGGPEVAFEDVEGQLANCSQVTVATPQGTATASLQALEVPDLGDGAVGLSTTTTGAGADGSQVTVPALVGIVQDGERQLILISTAPQGDAQLDPAAFTALLEQAYETQAEALD
ncbi:hypothetical protein [Blastococcus sp. SYSU D00820]